MRSKATLSWSAGLVRVTWDGLGRWHPSVLYSRGTDNQPPDGTARVTTWAAGLLIDLTPALGLRLDALHDTRSGSWQRLSAGAGVIVRFE